MRSLPKFLGLAVTAGLMALGWTHQARAAGCLDPNCCDDIDCVDKGGNVCGGMVCSWLTNPHTCQAASAGASDGWCDVDTDCKCNAEGATCVYPHCTYTIAPVVDAGPNPCNVDSECGSCGMVCSYTASPGATICVLADGGDPGKCDSAIGKSTCACADQVCASVTNTCSPAFNVLDAGPNPCNVDKECGACGTVCDHGASGHACVDVSLSSGYCVQSGGADCSCPGEICDTTTNICAFPDAGPPPDGGPDAGPPDAGPPPADGGPVVYCLADHDCADPKLGSGDGCGWVCGFKSTKPYRCVYASSGDPGICNVPGSNDCLTCGGVTQTCDTSSHTCTPPQFMEDAGPPPDAGPAADAGTKPDSGTSTDAGIKTCQVDADCGQLNLVCSHATVPYHCVLASTGDPGYCTMLANNANPCPAQGQTCISNRCNPPYGVDAGAGDAGGESSSGCGTSAKSSPDAGALLLALGLAGLLGLAATRRRKLE